MKTETIVHAHIVTGRDYLDLVERIESNIWTGEHIQTSWELFGQIDGVMLGAEFQGLTRDDAVMAFKHHKDGMIAHFEKELDKL